MSSGISNRSRWLPRFILDVLRLLLASSLNQRSEHSARGDHSPPENGRYATPRMHRCPDPPQPRTPTIVVRGPVQRSAPPERTHGTVQRPASAPPAAEVCGVQDLVLAEIPGGRSRQSGRGGDALYLAPDERIIQTILSSVRWRREQHGERPSVIGIDLSPTIVVEKRHRILRLLSGLEALVERIWVGRQHDAVH